mmetsp:Transcript_8787/g.16958  ORF Transcript_8787/g.16958 Transcript_8787/m.16958 type:complete len:103 (+) Transcript_8787:280-588(+)
MQRNAMHFTDPARIYLAAAGRNYGKRRAGSCCLPLWQIKTRSLHRSPTNRCTQCATLRDPTTALVLPRSFTDLPSHAARGGARGVECGMLLPTNARLSRFYS